MIDPCDPPTSLTESADGSLTYVVTDPIHIETITEFAVDPTFCTVVYSCDLTGTGLEDTVDWDPNLL